MFLYKTCYHQVRLQTTDSKVHNSSIAAEMPQPRQGCSNSHVSSALLSPTTVRRVVEINESSGVDTADRGRAGEARVLYLLNYNIEVTFYEMVEGGQVYVLYTVV